MAESIVTKTLAELFPGTGSVTPDGTVAVAVLLIVPAGMLPPTVELTFSVTDDPEFKLAVMLIPLPEPDAVPHVAPAPAEHVQVVPTSCDGIESTIDAPVTFDGPLFVTTIV